MYKFNLVVLCLCISFSHAVIFHNIASVTTSTSGDTFSVDLLIQGEGVGFDTASLEALGAANTHTWVTDDSDDDDYFDNGSPVVLTFDLGLDIAINEISTWSYSSVGGNRNNSVKDFSLQFATNAEGNAAFGTSIGYNPNFVANQDADLRHGHSFSEEVTARYVRMTITDNYYTSGGVGGDRVGLYEVAFGVIPEPSSAMLLGLALAGISLRRKKSPSN